jgi:putative ABC transport system substrate-binding protein
MTRYTDHVLKGTIPIDLPVQAPVMFELVIIFKTAKALGIPAQPFTDGRADEAIE